MTIQATARLGHPNVQTPATEVAGQGETPDPCTLLAGWLAEVFADGDGICDIDGMDLQDTMERCGLVTIEPFDPEKHQNLGGFEDGDMVVTLTAKARQAHKHYRAFARKQLTDTAKG